MGRAVPGRIAAGSRRLVPVTVQNRVLAAVIGVALLGMTVSGTLVLLTQWTRTMQRIDAAIEADVVQFRTLAGHGPTPRQPRFTGLEELLEITVQRQAPEADETYLALIDGVPRFVPSGERPIALERETALLAQVRQLPADAPVQLLTLTTSSGPIRYAAVQVRFADTPQVGTYVIAYALEPHRHQTVEAVQLYLAGMIVTLLIVALVGKAVSGRLLSPLRSLRATAQGINRSDLTRRIPVQGNDDVSDLTRTVNEMLDRLESAFQGQQDFLDDAGHELKTPLTIIRGHLEQMEPLDPIDVVEIRDLVIDEVDRMTRLVQDLTLLTKSGHPGFLRKEQIDVAVLLEDVIGKAVVLGARTWVLEASEPSTVSGDRQRLTQALLQLAANAVQHTVAGDEITLGCRTASSGDAVWMWVRDRGPGVAPGDAQRIFERFARAPVGLAGAGSGSGLGLAIVAAIAQAHGGKVWVESLPGNGATFFVEIPSGSA